MRFKHQQQYDKLPEINLTPMLNVMMGILAFFVMITMMLTTQQGVQVQLPNSPETSPPLSDPPEPLLVTLNNQGIVLADQPMTEAQLQQQMQRYLAENLEGFVVLQSEPDVPYEHVIQLLGKMKDVGGDRISLSIDE